MSFNNNKNEDLPFVSIIVPVYNDPNGIATTIQSLLKQTYLCDRFEIIVVDNGSNDETPDVVRRFEQNHELVQMYVEDEIQGSYAARNCGIRNARGSVIAFIDADMSVEETWLERGLEEMIGRDCDYLGGDVEMYIDGEETLAAFYDCNRYLQMQRFFERDGFVPTCNLFVRKSVFDDVGLFDGRLRSHGDREFGHRIGNTGKTMCFSEDVKALHPARGTIQEWMKRHARFGYSFQQIRRYYPDRYGHPILVPLHPRHWLLPLPWKISQEYPEWTQLSWKDRAGIVVIFYLSEAAMKYAEYKEFLKDVLELVSRKKKNRDMDKPY